MPEADHEEDLPSSNKEEVKKPLTEAELKAERLARFASESDADRSRRRANEFQALVNTHFENVNLAHQKYPVPLDVDYKKLSLKDQKLWNERRRDLDMANRAYHLAVKRTFAAHVEEDNHFRKLRAAKPAA